MHSNIYSELLNFSFPKGPSYLFLTEFPWKPEALSVFTCVWKSQLSCYSRWWATSLQQSISLLACCAVLVTSSQFPLPKLQRRKCLTTGEWSELQWGHGRAWAWHRVWMPGAGTWRMLKHLWNYCLLMSRLQGSGTLVCLCSASSQGRGPAGAHGDGTCLAQGGCAGGGCMAVSVFSALGQGAAEGCTQMPELRSTPRCCRAPDQRSTQSLYKLSSASTNASPGTHPVFRT